MSRDASRPLYGREAGGAQRVPDCKQAVKATLPKGCSSDKICLLRRAEHHLGWLVELFMRSTGRPRCSLVLCRCYILSSRGVTYEDYGVVAWCSMVQMMVVQRQGRGTGVSSVLQDFCHGQGCWRTFEGLEAQKKLLAAQHLQDSMPMDAMNPSAFFFSICSWGIRVCCEAPISTPSNKDDLSLSAPPRIIYRPRPDEPKRSLLNGQQLKHSVKVAFHPHQCGRHCRLTLHASLHHSLFRGL